MKASIALTHRVTFTVKKVSSRSMKGQSRVSRLLLVVSVSHVEYVCLDGLSCFVIESCECVFVWSPMHLSIIHTLSHFCWSSNDQTPLWQPNHHPAINSMNYQPKQCKSTKLVFSSCDAYKKFIQLSCWPPRQSNQAITSGLTPLKNWAEATDLTHSTD